MVALLALSVAGGLVTLSFSAFAFVTGTAPALPFPTDPSSPPRFAVFAPLSLTSITVSPPLTGVFTTSASALAAFALAITELFLLVLLVSPFRAATDGSDEEFDAVAPPPSPPTLLPSAAFRPVFFSTFQFRSSDTGRMLAVTGSAPPLSPPPVSGPGIRDTRAFLEESKLVSVSTAAAFSIFAPVASLSALRLRSSSRLLFATPLPGGRAFLPFFDCLR